MDYFKNKVDLLKKIRVARKFNENKRNEEIDFDIGRCKDCDTLLSLEELDDNLMVCPHCGNHYFIDVYKRLDTFFDQYEIINFESTSPNPLNFSGYDDKRRLAIEKTGLDEAVVICKGKIGEDSLYAFVMNSKFMMASMGIEVGERIVKCFEMAKKDKLPVVGFCASGGARMQEGIFSLMQMANTSFAVKEHCDEGNLYIAVLTDPTTGGVSASFANLADIIIAEPRARIGFTGRRVIEQTIGQKLPKDFQRAEFLYQHGFLDDIVERKNLKNYISILLSYHRRVNEN